MVRRWTQHDCRRVDASKIRRGERGANLIEFALSAVVLLMLIAGVVDFGGAFQNYIIITNAAREGARTASKLPCSAANRTQYVSAVVSAATSEAASGNVGGGGRLTSPTTPNLATTCPTAGNPVIVSVRHTYSTLFSAFVGAASFDLVAKAQMIFFGNDVSHLPEAEPVSSLHHLPVLRGGVPC